MIDGRMTASFYSKRPIYAVSMTDKSRGDAAPPVDDTATSSADDDVTDASLPMVLRRFLVNEVDGT